jgi:hypothetical protein
MAVMGARTLLVATLLSGSGSIALAQAPGDYDGDASGAPGMVAPQRVIVESCDCVMNVMENRWAVGFSIGSFGTTPDHGSAATTQFDIGELALRFRATPHLELELAVSGGHEHLGDGTQSDIMLSTVAIAARYRFRIHGHWNWWLMGGLGAATIASDSATSDQRDANQRPMLELGVGLEHRWNQFALQAELRANSMGPTKGNNLMPDLAIGGGAPTDTYSGGALTIGASYYF